MFEIDVKLWELDDERIRALYVGDITDYEFHQMINPMDPFETTGGLIRLVTKEELEIRKSQYIKQHVDWIKNTGGFHTAIIYQHKDEFIQVFPEFKERIDSIIIQIDKENCKGCTANSKFQPIYEELMKFKYDGRDLTPLKVDEKIIKKLKGEPINFLESSVVVPTGAFDKTFPPKLAIPLTEQKELEKGRFTLIRSNLTLTPNRTSCWDCVKKHLFTCVIFTREILNGYTIEKNYDHEHYLLANFEQAIDEAQKFPETYKKLFPMYEILLRKDYTMLLNSMLKLIEVEDHLRTDNDLLLVIGYLSEAGELMINIDKEVAEQIRSIRAGLAKQRENLNTLKEI